MWYRSIKDKLKWQQKNRVQVGKKQPVKMRSATRSCPYHYHSFFHTNFHNWIQLLVVNRKNNAYTQINIAQEYKSVQPLHSLEIKSGLQVRQAIFCSPFTLCYTYVRYPRFETWRKRMMGSVWSLISSKVFMKLKFRGKGYYLFRSRRNALSFRFGYSHRVYRFPGLVWYKMMSKTEVFIWGRSYLPVWNFARSIKQIRPHNQYTGKGIRFIRQITYKKLGKVGSYR